MSFPSFVSGEVLTAADMNAVGLWRITNCTVTSVGGTAATASSGVITIGTGNTSVTVNNAFSADYENYKIIINGGVGSATNNLGLQLGASTTGYYSNLNYSAYNPAGVGAFTDNNANRFTRAGTTTVNSSFMNLELLSPNLAKVTGMSCFFAISDITQGAGQVAGFHNVATAYTSFTIIPAAGTLTGGTIRVYGFRN